LLSGWFNRRIRQALVEEKRVLRSRIAVQEDGRERMVFGYLRQDAQL
jgi:hypothetical protein